MAVGKVLGADKKLGFPRRPLIYWPLCKSPKLAQMAQTIVRVLESQTRPLFHTVGSTEYEIIIENLNFDFGGPKLVNFGSNWTKIGPKRPKS